MPDTTTETEARVLASVDSLRDRLSEALSRAIAVESVNPKYPGQTYNSLVGAEERLNAFIKELYEEAGATVTMIAVEKGRSNAVGVVGGMHHSGSARSLILNGHIDVVPPGRVSDWTAAGPFSGLVDSDCIYGRGALDDKGGVVAHAVAAIALKDAGIKLDGDLVLQSVVGEEMGDHEAGVSAVIDAGFSADAAIVCEPSGLGGVPNFIGAAPGLLWFDVTIPGLQAHSGLRGFTVHQTLDGQRLGVNAIDKGFKIYTALRALEDEWAVTKRHPLFEPGQFGILPGVIEGGPEGVKVPFSLSDSVTIRYCIYHTPDDSNADVKEEIERRIRQAADFDPWLRDHRPTIEWQLEWPPTIMGEGSTIMDTLREANVAASAGTRYADRARVTGFSGVCDATWLQNAGIPSVVFGAGDCKLAHARNENVPLDELVTVAKTYALAALRWCA